MVSVFSGIFFFKTYTRYFWPQTRNYESRLKKKFCKEKYTTHKKVQGKEYRKIQVVFYLYLISMARHLFGKKLAPRAKKVLLAP